MVIQRGWKHSSDNLHHSSDDSNGSSHTISSTNTNSSRGNLCTMSSVTPQLADGYFAKLNQRYGMALIGPRMSSESLMRSLELLRINVQQAFNKEIDTVVRNFMEVYFEPAFKNLQNNLGDHVCSEDVLRKMACALLENSKSQYNIRTKPNIGILRNQDPSSMRTQITQQLISALKRPATQIVSQTQDLVIPAKKPLIQLQQRLDTVNVTTLPSHQQQQHQQQQSPPQQARRRIFWNTSNISTETKFVLDVEANQAFGLGTDGRERLASKHPELIRYLPDEEDRNWLVQENIIPQQNKNSRFLFLVYDEVRKLSQSDMYQSRANLNLQMLHAFTVPNFIIQKMRTFFVDLNVKSRGLITSSFTTNNGVSHLRNALLQGSPLATSVTSSSNAVNNTSGPSCLPSSTTVKPKSSLSSQHATLTALLNSNNEAQVVNLEGNNQLASS